MATLLHKIGSDLVEDGSVLCGDVGDVEDGLGVVGVHVEDGRVRHAGHVRAVRRGAGVPEESQPQEQSHTKTVISLSLSPGVGGESDLVVGDDVDGALGGVLGELAHVEALVDDALSGEGGVAVEQHGHDLLALVVAAVELLGLHLALQEGEKAWIEVGNPDCVVSLLLGAD